MDELLVPVEGFPNYVVSNYGRVVNVKRDRDLKPCIEKHNGSLFVSLSREGIKYRWYLNRLVARAFFVDYSDEYEVWHISQDKTDCSVGNLHISDYRVGVVRG